MGLLSKLKSLLGVGEESPSRGGDVDVTVEREPTDVAAEDERAVKAPVSETTPGTDGDQTAGEPTDSGATAEDAVDAGEAVEEPTDAEAATAEAADEADEAADEEADVEPPETADGPAAESIEDIKGIGPSYAGRLGDAGVETVGDLADREADALADETGLSEKRIGRWIERANARLR